VGPASSSLSGRSQPTVLPSGQVKIGCWPGSLSLQPVTLQSAALAAPDTPANTERPSKAVIIVLMIISPSRFVSAIRSNVGTRHGNVCYTIALISLVLPKADAKLGHHNTPERSGCGRDRLPRLTPRTAGLVRGQLTHPPEALEAGKRLTWPGGMRSALGSERIGGRNVTVDEG